MAQQEQIDTLTYYARKYVCACLTYFHEFKQLKPFAKRAEVSKYLIHFFLCSLYRRFYRLKFNIRENDYFLCTLTAFLTNFFFESKP